LNSEAKFDAEIDRLCNLGALDHISKKGEKSKQKESSGKSKGNFPKIIYLYLLYQGLPTWVTRPPGGI
jgi:hypothetical protein